MPRGSAGHRVGQSVVVPQLAERGGDASAAYGDGVYERVQAIRRSWDPLERFMASRRIATR